MRPSWSLLALPAFACSSESNGTLRIVTGAETDTFSRAPAPVMLRVDSVDSSGKTSSIATVTLPTSNIDLGKLGQNTVASLQVTGLGANGERLVFGESLPVTFGALDGLSVPLFVQRTGELARMPGPLSDQREDPTLAILGGRYLFVGAGRDPSVALTTQLYDFASDAPVISPPVIARAPRSIAVVGTAAWLIDEGGATRLDFESGTQADVTAPSGATFGDVAGGATVFAADGSQYVVGATRTAGMPTAAVLAIDSSGSHPSWLALTAPRLGAAAAWVEGRGLVVVGGSASAPGVEVVGVGAASGTGLAYPPDATIGAGAAVLDSQHVVVAGGLRADGHDAGARSIDLACAMQCAPSPWLALPAALVSTQAFSKTGGAVVLVVGDDVSGATHVYEVTKTSATELPTKAVHTRARATIAPVGSVVLFGGAPEIESYMP
ncbi:MAG: hypothetical protein M3O50_19720 [Myxococcota bacterium]|nr:hypothetical protein [Myxococcota bacterium]